MLRKVYDVLSLKMKDLFIVTGRCSYEIFLWQMFVFTFLPYSIFYTVLNNKLLAIGAFILFDFILSIVPLVLYQYYKKSIKDKM